MISKLILAFLILFHISRPTWSLSHKLEERVLQGKLAKRGKFPYVVHLTIPPMICTGSILTPLWVVSAANCFTDYLKYNVSIKDAYIEITAGAIDTSVGNGQKRRGVQSVVIEPNKKKGELPPVYNNNVMLLKVSEPFEFNADVGPITIAKRPLPEGKTLFCTQVGYGITEIPTGPTSIQLPINTKLYYTYGTLDGDKYSCRNRAIKDKSRSKKLAAHWGEEHLCVDQVDYKSAPCIGDFGGPIVCDGLHVGTLCGFENVGRQNATCGTKGNYNIYMFLGFYEDWLREHIPDLPAFKLVKGSPSPMVRGSTRGGENRLHVADTFLVVVNCFVFIRYIYL